MLANCLNGLAALGPEGLPALLGAMLLAGLAGGATHCAGMCGPFVIAQAAAQADRTAAGGMLRRLAGAALLPYHLGRAIGYAGLGALAGGAMGVVAGLAAPGMLAVPLGLAAVAMLGQAVARLPRRFALPRVPHLLPAPRLPAAAFRFGMGLTAGGPAVFRTFVLGLLLSALPCGLLYAALAGAAAAGGALAGALAMLAFVLGTVPALIGVALLGRFFGRRLGPALRTASALVLFVNAAVLAGLALRVAASPA